VTYPPDMPRPDRPDRYSMRRLFIPTSWDPETLKHFRATVRGALHSKNLDRVQRLFGHHVNPDSDAFRAFLFGWVSLEVLVNRVYEEQRKHFFDEVRSNSATLFMKRFFDRAISVLDEQDRIRLTDKFNIIAAFQKNSAAAEKAVETFVRLKKIRDNLFHGDDLDESNLPVEELFNLLAKYLSAYLK